MSTQAAGGTGPVATGATGAAPLEPPLEPPVEAARSPADLPAVGATERFDSDLLHNFARSPVAMASAAVALLLTGGALLAPWIAPTNPFDLASLDLNNALLPPLGSADARAAFPLGTDDQGRDILSTILYGSRISIGVGLASVLLALLIGVVLGLTAGFAGGRLDALIMRVADVQLSFPAILIALLINGVARTVLPHGTDIDALALFVLIGSIALANWVNYARTVRGSTLVEKNKEYVLAARVTGVPTWRIMLQHVLPNVTGPLLVIATINVATAIITEATLSFLGVGVPPTTPSLGSMINSGNNFLYSGEWWLVVFPGAALVLLCMSVNLLGDWLRDALNPKLR